MRTQILYKFPVCNDSVSGDLGTYTGSTHNLMLAVSLGLNTNIMHNLRVFGNPFQYIVAIFVRIADSIDKNICDFESLT